MNSECEQEECVRKFDLSPQSPQTLYF